ncbi:hypothetical protein EAP59_25245 [Salmonella enterica]|nr:hypothetical protein [Salmonella enterica subsp. enterica serovar Duisburg]EAP0829208.1 hypothetical protein [Salmonella enterica]OIN40847.1 hypothetical protein AO411_2024345 [Salmonella enterica subsp. enterica serovar Sarajane]EAQ9952393.1 hypothetical protein [Salmonella enterica]EAQ9961470.1 hypothetical protein [Salmonella enterica]
MPPAARMLQFVLSYVLLLLHWFPERRQNLTWEEGKWSSSKTTIYPFYLFYPFFRKNVISMSLIYNHFYF